MVRYDAALHELLYDPETYRDRVMITPSPLLSAYCEHYALISNHDGRSLPIIILPDLSAYLILYERSVNGPTVCDIKLIGPRSKAIRINHAGRLRTFIVKFRPGAFAYFVDGPVSDITDMALPHDALWCDEGGTVTALMNAGLTDSAFVTRLERWLAEKVRRQNNRDVLAAAFIALSQKEPIVHTVRSAASALGVSERYLRTAISQTTGLTPNLALRIGRLTRSILYREKDPHSSFAAAAYDAGYYDQSHMIDEYQALIGCSPGKLF